LLIIARLSAKTHTSRYTKAMAGILAGLAGMVGAQAAELPSYEAIYDVRLTHASATMGPRSAVGTLELRFAKTCDGWDTKSHIQLDLSFRSGATSAHERFFSSWESLDGRAYRFAVRTIKDNKAVESYTGTASLTQSGGTAIYEFPPRGDKKSPRTTTVALPRDTSFPAGNLRALLERAYRREALFRSVVLNGESSSGPRAISAAIGPRLDKEQGDGGAIPTGDATLLGSASWRMSAAYFNLDENRDTPNFELNSRLYESGITSFFEQTFNDFAISANLKRLRHLPPPAC
jgi:hypothetical protein